MRAVDDMSSSRVNDASRVLEKLTYDSLDLFFEVLQDLTGTMRVAFIDLSHTEGNVILCIGRPH